MDHYLKRNETIQPEPENLTTSAFLKKLTFRDVVFIVALATKPLYFFRSGTLQLSDMLFALLFLMVVFSGRPLFNDQKTTRWIACFFICLIYQFAVNAFWYYNVQTTLRADTSFLKSTLYYVFNFLVCISIFQLASLRGFSYTLRLYLIGTALSLFVAAIGVLLQYEGRGRATGTFNNPNQLGYFSIVILTAVTYFAKNIRPSIRILLVMLCITLSIMSLSKASILATSVLLFAYFINSRDRIGAGKLVSVMLSIIAVGVLIYILMYADWESLNEQQLIISLRKRLGSITTENDSALGASRGYDRMKEIGGWIVTGVGEGANYRFLTMPGKEVHSLYASVIVSYGMIGFFTMTWLVGSAITNNRSVIRSLLCFSGVLAYCVTHNGVRSTLLWALIAMLLITPERNDSSQKAIETPASALGKSP